MRASASACCRSRSSMRAAVAISFLAQAAASAASARFSALAEASCGRFLFQFRGQAFQLLGAGGQFGQRLAGQGVAEDPSAAPAPVAAGMAGRGRGHDRCIDPTCGRCFRMRRRSGKAGAAASSRDERRRTVVSRHASLTSREWPVIRSGFSRPIRSSIVGATSARRPLFELRAFGRAKGDDRHVQRGMGGVGLVGLRDPPSSRYCHDRR